MLYHNSSPPAEAAQTVQETHGEEAVLNQSQWPLSERYLCPPNIWNPWSAGIYWETSTTVNMLEIQSRYEDLQTLARSLAERSLALSHVRTLPFRRKGVPFEMRKGPRVASCRRSRRTPR